MSSPSAWIGRVRTLLAVAVISGAVVLPAASGAAAPGQMPAQAASPVHRVSSTVADAGGPSISSDGRWVVFAGKIGDRESVFRTDRQTNSTVEMSPIPPGVRAGHTIHARLSADGCVIAAVSEIAFDLFRDDDRDDRWDVYRLVVPECGGQPNGWELVSGAELTGIARDDVFTDSAPALTGSGAQIAYVHQAPGAPDGVATISIVDVTVPINETGRVQRVAGMPPEAPGGAFKYRGARDPVISQNGRHLAFVSDTTASEALPGWGTGPVLGEHAVSQVYVWDRQVEDQRRAVRLISGHDGVASAAGGAEPDMSEDGRVIVFTSRDRTLLPANLTHCTPDCPSQVYRFDRDTDGNGIFDEPARRPQLALVSAVDAGVVPLGLPEAGDAPSWAPTVNADGSQIAFVTDATNLLPSKRAGGGGEDDGDLLVAEFVLGSIRRVLDGADTTGVPGAHGNPALSKTGQVIAFDTMAAAAIPGANVLGGNGGGAVVTVEATPQLSLAAVDFGTVTLGFESTELYATVLNAGPGAFEPSVVESSSPNFKITGGTCFRGIIIAAGGKCSINLTFNPTEPRAFSATLSVRGVGAGGGSVSTTIRGAAGVPALLADPGGVDLARGVVGLRGDQVAIDIENIGFVPTGIARLDIAGAHPDDFRIVTEACTRRALNPDASCAVGIEFVPTGAGYRSALLIATAVDGAYTTAVLGGFADYDPDLRIAEPTARPGEQFWVGGSGFPANSVVSLGFDDGGNPFATIPTTPDGTFLVSVTLPARIRIGPRVLVASSPGGVVADRAIEVLGSRDTTTAAVPGYGLG
ncbi:MAG TPA: choice-of-anchor D domain-containing protein [Ilumatobacter sp.]|nr:choice-of-anchor D domain-containing protein [Ilumatobacter sp.]